MEAYYACLRRLLRILRMHPAHELWQSEGFKQRPSAICPDTGVVPSLCGEPRTTGASALTKLGGVAGKSCLVGSAVQADPATQEPSDHDGVAATPLPHTIILDDTLRVHVQDDRSLENVNLHLASDDPSLDEDIRSQRVTEPQELNR